MITLNVEKYCQNCDGFTPVVETAILSPVARPGEKYMEVCCENRRKCAAMYRHIEKQFKTQNETNTILSIDGGF